MTREFIKNQFWKIITSIMLFLSVALIFLIVKNVGQIQGNARVINYAGIVRGATQRLVKLEMAGVQNDDLIIKLDQILHELQNGGTEYNLTVLQDYNYQTKLSTLAKEWVFLKQDIYITRNYGIDQSSILERSEKHFVMADETVTAAESYADGLVMTLSRIEFILILDILIIIIILFSQMFFKMRLLKINQELESKVYIDDHTGLPNKDYCELRLSAYDSLPITKKFACIMFDLNNLKTINDSMGHKTGDKLILDFAALLREVLPEDVFKGRYGGDEFIAILEGNTVDHIEDYILEIKKKAAARKSRDLFSIEFSYGFEISTNSTAKDLHELLILADEKMYVNKRKSKENNMNIIKQ